MTLNYHFNNIWFCISSKVEREYTTMSNMKITKQDGSSITRLQSLSI